MMTITSAEKLKLKLIWVALIFGMTQCLSAAEYNEEQTAYNAAIKIISDRGWLRVFVRSIPYEVVEDFEGVTVKSKENRALCSSGAQYRITWDAPTHREDGTALAGPIDYAIKKAGEVIANPACCEHITTEYIGLSIYAIDQNGVESAPAELPEP